jgi:GNAT superfamily N-acetyltransferase
MELAHLEFEDAGILASLYNQFARDVPFCFPVSEDEFAAGMLAQWDDHGDHIHLHDQHLLICRRGAEVVGFAHCGVGPWDHVERGIVRFLCYLPGDRMVGQLLLDGSERLLQELRATEAVAFARPYPYPFHHNATGTLSGKLAHIIGLLGANEYALAPDPPYPRCEELLFDWPDYDVPVPSPPDKGLSIERSVVEVGPRLPKATFRLLCNDTIVGESETWPVGRWVRAKAAQSMFAISIDIGEGWQGRGWGSYLLRHALCEMRELGYRRSALGTNLGNYRAIAFYSNLGFKVAGTAYGFHKKLA